MVLTLSSEKSCSNLFSSVFHLSPKELIENLDYCKIVLTPDNEYVIPICSFAYNSEQLENIKERIVENMVNKNISHEVFTPEQLSNITNTWFVHEYRQGYLIKLHDIFVQLPFIEKITGLSLPATNK